MKYKEVLPISLEEAENAVNSKNPEIVCDGLLRLTYHDSDWQRVQNLCLHFIKSENIQIRSLAVTCLGHLARIHHTLDIEQVIPILKNLLQDKEIAGRVEDTLEDIEMFIQ